MPTSKWLIAFVLVSSLATSASAQEVGDLLVVRKDKAPIRLAEGPTRQVARGELLLVNKVDNHQFLVRCSIRNDDGVEGWMNDADVLSLSRALDALNEELRRKPTAEGYAIRASIWGAKHEFDQTLADCDQAIRLDPKCWLAFHYRAAARFLKGESDRAISDFDEAIRLNPTAARCYAGRARVRTAKGQYEKAIADYDHALHINPRYSPAYTGHADVLASQRKYTPAIARCDEAIRCDPKSSRAYASRGYIRYANRKYAEAISDYDESIRLSPKTAITYLNRGTARAAMEDYDQCLVDYETALRLADPKDFLPLVAHAWFRATCADVRCRDAKKSLKDAKKACELADWKNAAGLEALAAAYAEKGDFLNAVTWQNKAIDLVPEQQTRKLTELRYHLSLYKSLRPYHDKPPSG